MTPTTIATIAQFRIDFTRSRDRERDARDSGFPPAIARAEMELQAFYANAILRLSAMR